VPYKRNKIRELWNRKTLNQVLVLEMMIYQARKSLKYVKRRRLEELLKLGMPASQVLEAASA